MKITLVILFAVLAVIGLVVFALQRMNRPQPAKEIADWLEHKYAAFGKTTDEILSHENASNGREILGALRYRIGQKADARGEASLSETERRILAADELEAEVNNGGFDQYFFNSAGEDTEIALAGLREMGAAGTALLLERAMAVFPGGKPPADRFKRQEVMEQIAAQSKPVWSQCDDEFYKRTENLGGLSLAYAKKKRTDIVLP